MSGAQFSGPFGDGIRHVEELIALFVEHQMVIAEVWPGKMPVEILGFQIKGEYIGQQRIQGLLDSGDSFSRQIGCGTQA